MSNRHATPAQDQGLDAVYFLMFPGWENELRSNRWHYASRWATHVPVTLVQTRPSLRLSKSHWETEPRIEGCRILYVRAVRWDDGSLIDGLVQAEQVRRDIAKRGYKKVAFWLYDPSYFMTWGMLPATVRVVHATENYFMYSNNSEDFLPRLEFCLRNADATFCCSDGVAASYGPRAGGRVETLTNGCDYEFYAGSTPDGDLAALHAEFERIAVFAGNIDERLDYALIADAAKRKTDVLFALFGPKNIPNPEYLAAFEELLARPNVRYFGPVPVEKLPSIYAACDLGMLPYVFEPLLYENTFPLKTFEMIAAGLPIVARNLKMIEPFAGEGLLYAHNDAEFAAAFGPNALAALTDSARERLAALAKAQDYGVKFEAAHEIVTRMAQSSRPSAPMRELFSLRFDSFEYPVFLPASVRADANPVMAALLPTILFLYRLTKIVRRAVEGLALMLPRQARRWLKKCVPARIVRFIVG